MDYGQSKSTPSGQPTDAFFTSGVGTNQESNNNYESENNLDLNTRAEQLNPITLVKLMKELNFNYD